MSSAAALEREHPPRLLFSALSDERLSKLAAQGSAPAFAAIYKRHHQDVYRYCKSVIGNEHDARDALQETMIKAMRALEGERREIALRPWLFRIAHNESVSLVRRRRPSAPLDAIAEPASAGGDDESVNERVRELFDDLGELTPQQRGALVMRELNGFSFAEIAAAMAVSAAAAKQAVYEARQALLEIARGRETDCAEIRKRISARDRRLLRGRTAAAHLRSCADCREFEAGIGIRGERLAAVSPLPAAASAGILEQVLGVAGGTAGGGGIAIAAAGGSLTAIAKLGVAGVVALGVGTVAIEGRDSDPPGGSAATGGSAAPVVERLSAPNAEQAVRAEPGSGAGPAAAKGGGDRSGSGRDGGPGGSADTAAAGPETGPGSPSAGGGENASETHGPSSSSTAQPSNPSDGPADGPATPEAQPGTAGGGAGGEDAGGTGGAESSGGGSSAGGSSGGGSTGTGTGEVLPPGHGGTPPGQGGTPPGQGGTPSPGHGGTPPGQGGTPPGQGGTPPGQIETPPGESGTPPGQGGTPPGQGGTPPGHGGTPPGQGGTPPGQGNGHH